MFSDHCDRALDLMNEGNYAESLAEWEKAYAILHSRHPQSSVDKAELQLNMAICASHLGRHADAIEMAEWVVEYYEWTVMHESDDGQRGFFVLTDVAARAGDYTRAEQASDAALQALKREPDFASPRSVCATAIQRAGLALRTNRPESCLEAVDFALKDMARRSREPGLDPDDKREILFQEAQVLEYRGQVRQAAGQRSEAIADYEAAIKKYEEAWGEGDETADDARKLLAAVRA